MCLRIFFVLTIQGDYYVISGQKKFITSGMKADYFTVAVRTGADGMGGISLILVEAVWPKSVPMLTL